MNEHDERARKQEGNKEEERRKDVLTIWFDGALRGHRLHVKGANDFQRPVPNFNRPVSGPRDHFLLPHHLHGRHHPTVGGHHPAHFGAAPHVQLPVGTAGDQGVPQRTCQHRHMVKHPQWETSKNSEH